MASLQSNRNPKTGSLFKFLKLLLVYVCECFACMYLCALYVCLVPAAARRRCQETQNWRSRWLWATMLVLETNQVSTCSLFGLSLVAKTQGLPIGHICTDILKFTLIDLKYMIFAMGGIIIKLEYL